VAHLQAAGIAVTVVNGITAGLAAVTTLGVPLTHREHAHGAVFVTGHARPGDAGIDWPALAATAHQARLTLVIYMGVSGAARIQQALLQGLPGSTPVAIIQHASLPQQRHAACTLAELHHTLAAEQLGQPQRDRGRRRAARSAGRGRSPEPCRLILRVAMPDRQPAGPASRPAPATPALVRSRSARCKARVRWRLRY